MRKRSVALARTLVVLVAGVIDKAASTVLELAAGGCLVVAAAQVHAGLAWLAAAVVLETQVFQREHRKLSVPRRRRRSSQ